jgi:hypothetical protein
MDYDKLEMKLRKIVEKRLREGWYMFPDNYYTQDGSCCAVGVVVADRVEYDESGVLTAGCDATWAFAKEFGGVAIGSLIAGFDNRFSRESTADAKLYDIGANIRRIYCDDNGQVE